MTPAAWLSCVAAAVIAVSLCLPGAGGRNRTGPKDDAARVNAASGEAAAPQPLDVGEEPRHPIAGSQAADGRGASLLSTLDALSARVDALDGYRLMGGACAEACPWMGVESVRVERGHLVCRCRKVNLGFAKVTR